jgi:hypothetical protein
MANVKAKAARRRPKRSSAGSSKMMLTTAFMTDLGTALPKGSTGFTFATPSKAAEALTGRPARVKPLLQRYGEAFAKSREAGCPVSFRVDVSPDGATTTTSVEDASAQRRRLPVEQVGERAPELEAALAAARKRGRIRAGELLAGEDMLSADDFARLLGTTRMTVNTKRQAGQVLGLEGAKRGFRFPAWQVDRDGKPYAELPVLLQRLGAPWAVYRFLVQRHGALDGLTGREALERGKGLDAIAAAEGIARGDFT